MWTDMLTPLRWLLRGPLFLLHATVLLLPCLLLLRFGKGCQFGERSLATLALTFWSRWACRLFGLWPSVQGAPAPGPILLVANHISWADIPLLHSVAPMSFVGKAEISRWPVFGFLADAGGTIYHERGSHDSSAGVMRQLQERLDQAGRVAVFPEGGIFPGQPPRPFHARMFKIAQEAECAVQPAMIRYLRKGQLDADVSFRPGEHFLVNILRLLGRPGCRAELRFLDAFHAGDQPRKALAQRAEAEVRTAYHAPIGIS